jgi:TPR repeat protein
MSYDPEYAMGLFGAGRYNEVIEYCRPFADQGIAEAQCELGTMYQMGVGTDADPQMAESLFLKAAEQGFPVAWCNLGTLYASGALDSADAVRAAFCYRRAYELGGPSHADYL